MTQTRSRKTPGNICLSFVSKNGAARRKKRRTRRRREKTEKTDREKLGWEKDYLRSSKVANPLKHGWQCGKWANSLVTLFVTCRSPRPKWRELFKMWVHKCFAAFITMIRWKKGSGKTKNAGNGRARRLVFSFVTLDVVWCQSSL